MKIAAFVTLAVPLVLAAAPAAASSDGAWAKFNLEVAERCAAASGMRNAHVSDIVGFDDSLGKVATLVTGREAVRSRKGMMLVQAKKLCIHDKRSRQTWIDEAKGWSAPDMR